MRWPSRKINKVNRSLRKIQTVLDSVHGIEGGLRFDSATGEFVAVCSSNGNNAHVMAEDASCEFLKPESVDNTIKLEYDIITNGKNHLYNHNPSMDKTTILSHFLFVQDHSWRLMLVISHVL